MLEKNCLKSLLFLYRFKESELQKLSNYYDENNLINQLCEGKKIKRDKTTTAILLLISVTGLSHKKIL